MELTASYVDAFPADLRARYEYFETRNAAAILEVTNPARFADLHAVLADFALTTADLVTPGGSESQVAKRLNTAFRDRGWRESRVDTTIGLRLKRMPYASAGELSPVVSTTEVVNEGYLVDNVADRVALDVEWNAKDGNLDRDLAAYRSLYDSALIDVAVMITRTQDGLRELGYNLARAQGQDRDSARRILGTTTSTNTTKLVPRLRRGDGGGCPILVVAMCESTWVPDEDTPSLADPRPAAHTDNFYALELELYEEDR